MKWPGLFYIENLEALGLQRGKTAREVIKVMGELAEKYGFKLRGHVHNLYGLCAECRAKAAKEL